MAKYDIEKQDSKELYWTQRRFITVHFISHLFILARQIVWFCKRVGI